MKRFASLVSLVLLLILAAVVSIRALRDLPSHAPPKASLIDAGKWQELGFGAIID